MVEVVLVTVEAVDGDRQVPATLRIHLGIGVQHPLVTRHGNGQASCLMQVVNIERDEFLGIDSVGRRHHADGQTHEVETLAGTNLHVEFRFRARHHRYGHAASGQCLSVDANLRTVGVSLVNGEQLQDGQTLGSLGLLALVAHIHLEVGCIVDGHATHILLV